VRAKNSGGSLLRHLADLCIAALAFWAVGIAVHSPLCPHLVFNTRQLFGLRGDEAIALGPRTLLMLAAALLASGAVVGALSERTRFWPSLAPSILLGALLVPMTARWCADGGWLNRRGFHDLAGASFVHLTAGLCAAVGAIVVKPRDGKYNRDGSSNVFPGHNLPLACTGVMLMVVAWFPYLLGFGIEAGRPVGLIGMNTILAVAAAGAASLGVAHFRYRKSDIYLTFSGVLAGLVAVTGGADAMSNLSAVITGAVAGVLIPLLMLQEDLVWRIDDPTGALVIHGVGGAWGILATGLFGSTNVARLKFIGVQLMGLGMVAAMALAISAVMFLILKRFVHLRARETDEFDGLDLAEHDIGSYPDFQQNTIKSYHLRET
jgi:Amt family ammonium transporter